MTDLITRKHLSSMLDVSESTIRRKEKLGMPVITIGRLKRYDPVKVLKWFHGQDKEGIK